MLNSNSQFRKLSPRPTDPEMAFRIGWWANEVFRKDEKVANEISRYRIVSRTAYLTLAFLCLMNVILSMIGRIDTFGVALMAFVAFGCLLFGSIMESFAEGDEKHRRDAFVSKYKE